MDEVFDSKIGKYFVIAYALFAIGVYLFVFLCGAASCSAYIILPIMPWAFILVEDFGLSFPWAIYPVFVLLNTSVAYILGVSIEWLYNKYTDYDQNDD